MGPCCFRYDKGDVSKYILNCTSLSRTSRYSDDEPLQSSSETIDGRRSDSYWEDSDESSRHNKARIAKSYDDFVNEKLAMPSVKRLAETFNKVPEKPSLSRVRSQHTCCSHVSLRVLDLTC